MVRARVYLGVIPEPSSSNKSIGRSATWPLGNAEFGKQGQDV